MTVAFNGDVFEDLVRLL